MTGVEVTSVGMPTACALACALPSPVFSRVRMSSLPRDHVREYIPSSSTCSPSSDSRDRAVPRGKPMRVARAPRLSCSPAACDIAIEFGAAVHEFRRFYRHTYRLGFPRWLASTSLLPSSLPWCHRDASSFPLVEACEHARENENEYRHADA